MYRYDFGDVTSTLSEIDYKDKESGGAEYLEEMSQQIN